MKELQYLINDVREQTDNTDTNGIKDREIIRYFNDGIKSIQAMIFKNNPLCSYFQASVIYAPVVGSREYTLPSDCFAENAVSLVELESNGKFHPIERVWPEEGNAFFGWFTRGKKLIISGCTDREIGQRIKVHYFQRADKAGLSVARLTAKATAFLTTFEDMTIPKPELLKQDNALTVVDQMGAIVQTLKATGITEPNTVFVMAYGPLEATLPTLDGLDLTVSAHYHYIVWGRSASFVIPFPDEVEPYLMDYVAQRIAGRNQYGEDWNKFNFWSSEERGNIIAIFADASQAEVRTPITDTSYLEI